jgi:predicted nucleotidyltransferase
MESIVAGRLAKALIEVPGVQAVVLGGSHCTGTATELSDLDIGVYYGEGLETQQMSAVLTSLDDAHRENLLNKPGEWGKWINGGAWLTVEGQKADILLRDSKRVGRVIDDCQQGKVTVDFQAGHPFGFVNAIYMGEVKYCLPMEDAQNVMADLKRRAEPVSKSYRDAASKWFLWEAEFSVMTGRSSIGKKDIVYASGALFRGILCLTQALFAFGGEILLNEKGALRRLAQYDFCPPGFVLGMEAVLTGLDKNNLGPDFDLLEEKCRVVSKLLQGNE